MKTLSKSLVAISLALACFTTTQALADDGKCSDKYDRISVVGEGEIKVMPDVVSLEYRVSSLKGTAKEARDEVEKTVSAFSKSVGTLKLDKDAFIADNITIMPRYQWNEAKKKQEQIGYEAARNVSVKLKDFTLIGKVSDEALKAGINQISGFNYTISDPKKYEHEAAQLAIADANDKAAFLAKGFNTKVGHPCSLSFEERSYGSPYRLMSVSPMARNTAEAQAAPDTYTVEKVTISSRVNATFSIKE